MNKQLYQARFIGVHGSLGYVANKLYMLFIWQDEQEIRIKREIGGGYCPYTSLHNFFENWTDVRKIY
jgi:hypothetical protein